MFETEDEVLLASRNTHPLNIKTRLSTAVLQRRSMPCKTQVIYWLDITDNLTQSGTMPEETLTGTVSTLG